MLLGLGGFGCGNATVELPVERAVLTPPPRVPAPIERDHPARVVVDLEVVEKTMRLADGVEYMFWTFGGTVPGSFIRVREGDRVEFNLHNHTDNTLPHNIDLHAVTGPGGGAAASFTAPGQSSRFEFTARHPGLFVYHCATQPVGLHVANGMYGLILVEPKAGLPEVDREYYVMQSEFYTRGAYGEEGDQPFSMDKAVREQPDYVVFNGAVGALMDERALTAKTGETVRLFVGNGGPNLASSFHVIGEIFDKVYIEAGDRVNHHVQTTTVPPGGATIVEFGVETPGTFLLVDHALFRAFHKGTLGMLKVEGPENPVVFQPGEVGPEERRAPRVPSESAPAPTPPPLEGALEESMRRGKKVYAASCLPCHQADGTGMARVFPPLAASDYLMEDLDRAVDIVIRGKRGEIVVNGETYNQVMTPQNLTDRQIADVMNYVTRSWGNAGEEVFGPGRVREVRESGKERGR